MPQNTIAELFTDPAVIGKIKEKLPKLFRIAEIESSRANKIGMEVGSLREKIIIALLIYKFGAENVHADLPITEPEIDVIVDSKPMSIKTITKNGGVKAVWTVDAQSARNFINNYRPKCDIILVQIWWGEEKDSLFLIPLDVQKQIFDKIGRDKYLNMPRAGTNPRGVEFSREALQRMINHPSTKKIRINWVKKEVEHDVYERWVDYWRE